MSRSIMQTIVCAIGGVLGAGALLFALAGVAVAAVWLAGLALLLIIGLAIERWRYKPLAGRPPGPDWQATGERFVDPETGKTVTVYFHSGTGERRYVSA